MKHQIERARTERFFQTIDGDLVASRLEDVIDPSTGEPFQQSPVATMEELDRAVAAARHAQPAWGSLGWDVRARALERFADAIDEHLEWLATLHTLEQGMPFEQSVLFVRATSQRIRTVSGFRIEDRIAIEDETRRVVERWHPLGVVAAIAPWNGPLLLGMIKVVTALISGSAIVLKPSELTPLGTLELGRISIGIIPKGVLNVVGGGGATGAAMVSHPGFDKVSFTGSTATGIAIAEACARYLRPATLELGGNDAAILLPDGSIESLVTAAAQTGFSNNGQFCAAVKRIYAPANLAGEVARQLAEIAQSFTIGNGFEPGVTLGPIQNKKQFGKVCAIVEDAKASGGQILSGGAPLDRPGYFYPPTVVAGLRDGSRLVDEEQFGPVIPVIAYDNLEEVIATINSGPYGLTASIWTSDLGRGEALAGRIESGSAAVNRHAAFDPALPFPLIKQSGTGIDYADYGIKGTMRLQVITTIKPQPLPQANSAAGTVRPTVP